MKAKALSLSLEWARDVGHNSENVETDALVVVKGLKNTIRHSSELLIDVSTLLSYFVELKFLMSHALLIMQHMVLHNMLFEWIMNVFDWRKIHLQ